MKKYIVLLAALATAMVSTSCIQKNDQAGLAPSATPNPFYSSGGVEQEVRFSAKIKTSDYSIEQIQKLTDSQKKSFEKYSVKPVIAFLFGPLTHRELGAMQSNSTIVLDWNSAVQTTDSNGAAATELTYKYEGTWIISHQAIKNSALLNLPLPFSTDAVLTENWTQCTDSEPDHQTESFYWYFWDPTRYGCEHELGTHFQNIEVTLGKRTLNQVETYPEYSKLLQSAGVDNNLQMTFGFGYVTDVDDANPNTDADYGMTEYRDFVKFMNAEAKKLSLTKTAITLSDYLNRTGQTKEIGFRYQGVVKGATVDIKVVASANIDQMELFAKSYAHDHDGFFAWFGHSRVGSGFDAQNFKYMVDSSPNYYSISPNYQLVYWAGCNSYSYYTLPFFAQKAALNPVLDPNGTKALDLLSNGLPSLFSFNAYNAKLTYKALINWEQPTSYQKIVTDLEKYGRKYGGVTVLVNVLGDEDNN